MAAPTVSLPDKFPDFPRPGFRARLVFFCARHQTLSAIVSGTVLAFVAAGSGAAIALITGASIMGLLFVPVTGIVLAVSILIRMPHAWTKEAGPEVIGAAFCAATVSERPHLIAALQARLGNPLFSTPIDAVELARMFDGVHRKHGVHARRRAERERRMLERQRASLTIRAE